MDSALDESIDFLNSDDANEAVECANNSKPEELGSAHDLSVGDKILVQRRLDDNYYPGSASEYFENTADMVLKTMAVR